MPLIQHSTYSPPVLLGSGHAQTVYPSLFRRINDVAYVRERLDTSDGDFLDLDWSRMGVRRLAVLSHGLEGNSRRAYVTGMVRALNRSGWDVLAWNLRGCSGELNRTARMYHSGATSDLDAVVQHVRSLPGYDTITLVGFSLGGNVTLKYLGEQADDAVGSISAAVTFSVPCDLRSSAMRLARPSNRIYMRRFLTSLIGKVHQLSLEFPEILHPLGFDGIRSFLEFDDRYTAPMHGFDGAEDYWRRCSSRQFLPLIQVPTLLINASNDPFLAPECFPVDEARENPNLFFETPRSGGHVGFVAFDGGGEYWSEKRAVEFLKAHGER